MASRRNTDRESATEKRPHSRGEVTDVRGRPAIGHSAETASGLAGDVLAEKIIDTVREAILVLDAKLRVVRANDTFYKLFKVSPRETEGRLLYELGNGHWDIRELRRLLDEVLPENNVFSDFEIDGQFEAIGRRVMLLNGRRVDHVQLVLLAIEDITVRRMAERRRSSLLALSDGFRGAEHPQEVLDQAAMRLCEFLSCERVIFSELGVRQGQATILAEYPNGRNARKGADPLIAFGPGVLAAIEKADDFVIDDIREDSRLRDPAEYGCSGQPGTRAFAGLAQRRDHQRIGLMAVCSTEVHHWQTEELEFLRDVADRSWSAWDSALASAEVVMLNESLEEQVSQRTEILNFFARCDSRRE